MSWLFGGRNGGSSSNSDPEPPHRSDSEQENRNHAAAVSPRAAARAPSSVTATTPPAAAAVTMMSPHTPPAAQLLLEWDPMHRAVCEKEGVLAVRAEKVLRMAAQRSSCTPQQRLSLPPASAMLVWDSDERVQETLLEKLQGQRPLSSRKSNNSNKKKEIAPTTPATKTSSSPAITDYSSTPRKILSAVASPVQKMASMAQTLVNQIVSGGEDDSDYHFDHYQNNKNDTIDYSDDFSASAAIASLTTATAALSLTQQPPAAAAATVPLDALVICTDLALECLAFLQNALMAQQQQHEQQAVVVPSLQRWLVEQQQPHAGGEMAQFIARLSTRDFGLLVECLLPDTTSILRKVPDRPLYVLGGAATPSDDQVAVTLYDLQRCIASQEAKIAEWQAKADAHLERARAAQAEHRRLQRNSSSSNKSSLSGRAQHEMRLRQMYQRQVDQAQGALMNLHMSQQAVEASQHQTAVVDALRSATVTLRKVRGGAGNTEEDLTEAVDTVVDDLAEVLDEWQGVHETLASINNNGDNVDDDALLRELDELIEKDNGTGDGDAPLAATTAAAAESLSSSSAAAPDGPTKSPPAGEASKERAENEKQPVASLS